MNRFARRLARNLDHPIDGACGARPPGTPLAAGIGAAIGSLCGSIGGGSPLVVGIAAGAGVIVAYAILLLRARSGGTALSMALVVAAERLELYRLSLLRASTPVALVRSIPYTEISDIRTRRRWFELVITVIAKGGALEITTVRGGGGPRTVEALRRRIAA